MVINILYFITLFQVQQLIEAMTNIQTARDLGEEDEAELQRANQLFDKIVADIVGEPFHR